MAFWLLLPFAGMSGAGIVESLHSRSAVSFGVSLSLFAAWLLIPFLAQRAALGARHHFPSSLTPEWVPVLLEALYAPSRITRREASLLLVAALPDADAMVLSSLPHHVSHVAQALNACRGTAEGRRAALAILGAIERLGDRRLLLPVEDLRIGRSSPEVREAARRCEATIEERQRRLAREATLLRPADRKPGGELLRPVSNPETAPEQLLRATDDALDGTTEISH